LYSFSSTALLLSHLRLGLWVLSTCSSCPSLLLLLLLLQGVVQPSYVDALPACCFPDPQLRTFSSEQHGSMTLQQLGIGPGRILVLGMVRRRCCCCCFRAFSFSITCWWFSGV
jgi:hypothetical protein